MRSDGRRAARKRRNWVLSVFVARSKQFIYFDAYIAWETNMHWAELTSNFEWVLIKCSECYAWHALSSPHAPHEEASERWRMSVDRYLCGWTFIVPRHRIFRHRFIEMRERDWDTLSLRREHMFSRPPQRENRIQQLVAFISFGFSLSLSPIAYLLALLLLSVSTDELVSDIRSQFTHTHAPTTANESNEKKIVWRSILE